MHPDAGIQAKCFASPDGKASLCHLVPIILWAHYKRPYDGTALHVLLCTVPKACYRNLNGRRYRPGTKTGR